MIITLLAWIWIAAAAFLWGFAFLQMRLFRHIAVLHTPDTLFLSGLCLLTVYAQIYSLFSCVGMIASLLLPISCLAILLVYARPIGRFVKGVLLGAPPWFWFLLPAVLVFICILTSGYTFHYDTDLYHAQAIRWVETYGLVPGLGNLHNRFAYNSSFFCLQALFSLSFLAGQSLHGLNGLITLVMVLYSLSSLSLLRGRIRPVSDLLKLSILFYLAWEETLLMVSSPGSDILTLSMVLYLLAKWAEYTEEEVTSPYPYALLSLLGVWALTLKLSAGAILLLALYPAWLLIRDKRWKEIGILVGMGALILLPFLIRNVLISGYLLYPYPGLDLFAVDWKMPASQALDDSREIMAWGRGMTDRSLYLAPFSQWFPVWYGRLSLPFRLLVWGNALCLCLLPLWGIPRLLGKKGPGFPLLLALITGVAGLLMWFASAPLTRYGLVYLLILPALCLGYGISALSPALLQKPRRGRILVPLAGILLLAAACSSFPGSFHRVSSYSGKPPLLRPMDYRYAEHTSISWEGITVSVPIGSDCIGYHFFPGTTHAARLDTIRMRGDTIREGFRLAPEYKDTPLFSDGTPAEK